MSVSDILNLLSCLAPFLFLGLGMLLKIGLDRIPIGKRSRLEQELADVLALVEQAGPALGGSERLALAGSVLSALLGRAGLRVAGADLARLLAANEQAAVAVAHLLLGAGAAGPAPAPDAPQSDSLAPPHTPSAGAAPPPAAPPAAG